MAETRRRATFRILIRKIEPPFQRDFNHGVEYICQTFGFQDFSSQDNKTAVEIFKEIVKASERGNGITSTELSEKVKMSRGSVINHINNLLRAGLIVKEGRLYFARSRSMLRTIQGVEEDIKRVFVEMEQFAQEIDKEFGLLPYSQEKK